MNFANKISTFRILSVPFYIAAFVYYSPQRDYLRFWALGIFLAAAVSDALDGYIARKTKQYTKAGLILDPLGDKLVLVSSFICLYFIQDFPQGIKFPLSVTLIVVSRDAIILLGTLVVYMVKQSIDVHPTRWGKLTTTFQMASVVAVLLQLRWSFLFWWPAVFFTVISGVDYVMRGFKILYAVDIHRNNH